VSCIYNGVDLGKFRPREGSRSQGQRLRLLGVGRVGPEKNLLNAIKGIARFGAEFGYVPEVSWAGQRDLTRAGHQYWTELETLLASLPAVRDQWRWLGVHTNVPALLRDCDALLHPSLYEGLPNAVCEALAAGCPVLASDVCDHPRLVADRVSGFLFDPVDPESIAVALGKFARLSTDERRSMGVSARAFAVSALGIESMVDKYEALFTQLTFQRARA
jgi:glycosyltransferase involved in cell wall biosynthesis